jgi:hypothetical protein
MPAELVGAGVDGGAGDGAGAALIGAVGVVGDASRLQAAAMSAATIVAKTSESRIETFQAGGFL